MTIDIDLSEDFADDFDDGSDPNVLPALEELYGDDALPTDLDLDSMIATAVDPETPAPESDLIPDIAELQEDPGYLDAGFDEDAALFDDSSPDSHSLEDYEEPQLEVDPSLDSDSDFSSDDFGPEGDL